VRSVAALVDVTSFSFSSVGHRHAIPFFFLFLLFLRHTALGREDRHPSLYVHNPRCCCWLFFLGRVRLSYNLFFPFPFRLLQVTPDRNFLVPFPLPDGRQDHRLRGYAQALGLAPTNGQIALSSSALSRQTFFLISPPCTIQIE